ncbi:hypothetical protein EP7_002352 [Isosphaeraceae bacterium EP7]
MLMVWIVQAALIAAVIGLAVAQVLARSKVRELSHQVLSLKRLPAPPPVAPGRPGHRPRRRRDDAEASFPAGPRLIAVPRLAPPPGRRETMRRDAADQMAGRYGPIWALAEAGTPLAEIARESGLPIGQVELILGLRGRPARRKSAVAHGDASTNTTSKRFADEPPTWTR